MKTIASTVTTIKVPKNIIIRGNDSVDDMINKLLFVKGENKYQIVVLHRDCIICPLCKTRSNRNGHQVYGPQTYTCGNEQCKHLFVPNDTIPGARHSISEIIKGMKCVYHMGMSLRKASDYLKTKEINISHHGVRGWKHIAPDLLRALLNSIKPEFSDKSAIDAVKSIKKTLSWLKPWSKYEYAKVSTYTPMSLLEGEEIKSNAIECHEEDNEIILKINKPCTMKIDKDDNLTKGIIMASLNNDNIASTAEISDIFDVTEHVVNTNALKYLEGGSSNLIDKRGGSESKLTPEVMEKIIYHLLDSHLKSEKINNSTIAERVSSELESENLKISREIVRQFRNTINFDKTVEKLNLIKRASAEDLKKTKTKG
jgi:transposase